MLASSERTTDTVGRLLGMAGGAGKIKEDEGFILFLSALGMIGPVMILGALCMDSITHHDGQTSLILLPVLLVAAGMLPLGLLVEIGTLISAIRIRSRAGAILSVAGGVSIVVAGLVLFVMSKST